MVRNRVTSSNLSVRMSVSQKKPYSEPQRKLIIAFDIGLTFSCASYAVLTPGEVPVIQGVTQ